MTMTKTSTTIQQWSI